MRGVSQLTNRVAPFGVWLFLIISVAALIWVVLPLGKSVAEVTNNASTDISVRIETSVDESYLIGPIEPGESRKVSLKRQEGQIWVVAHYPDGETKESMKLYVSAGIDVSFVIGDESIEYRNVH